MTKKILCIGLGMLAALGVRAQVLELDLQKAIEIALDENPTIMVAGLEIERQRYVKHETVGNFLPAISAEGVYSHGLVVSEMMGIPAGPENTLQAAGTVGLPLVVPALWQTLKLNDQQMRAAVEAARASKLNLVNEVKKAYYMVLVGEESLSVLRGSEEMLAKTVDDTRTKFENEMASEYDLVTADVQLSNLQPTIYQAENGLQSARKMLCMLLGLPLGTEFDLEDSLRDMARLSAGGELAEGSVAENSDLRSLDIQHDLLRRQLGVLRTQRMPSLVAFGNVTLTGQDQINFGKYMTTGVRETTFQWQHPINIGARITVPIFAGFTNVSKERQLRNSIRQLELQRDYAEEGIRVQVDNARANIITAYARMQSGDKTIEQARKGYDISRVRFEGGMGTILELNSAELALTQARMNHAQSVYDYLAARADYEKLIGQGFE